MIARPIASGISSKTIAGVGNVLAGEAGGNNIGAGEIGSGDVVEDWNVGPVLGEHATAEPVDLTECDCSHARSIEPEADAANSAAEVKDIHGLFRLLTQPQ